MRRLDLSTWQGVLLALIGVALITLISMGIRLLMTFHGPAGPRAHEPTD
jgi:hypothetical protein